MSNSTEKLKQNIALFGYNPASIVNIHLNQLQETNSGIDIEDASNPFMLLMEATATNTSCAIEASESIARELYPELAVTNNELYHHMSDKDYLNRFATPGITTIKVQLPVDLIKQHAIYPSINSISKVIVFPRNTSFIIDGYTFYINYPIIIELLPQDIIRVLYDTSEISPIEIIKSNILKSNYVLIENVNYLEISIPVYQYVISSSIYTVDNSFDFSQELIFEDQYFYARVYTSKDNKTWEEILTTHSYKVYDQSKPTANLKVLENSVIVSIPSIYSTLNLLGNEIRVDIYSTKGNIDLDLSVFSPNDFSMSWNDLNPYNNDPVIYTLNNINDVIIYSTDIISGGTNSISFDQLKNNVVYHANASIVPIRPSDIEIGLNELGYTVQKTIDSVTDRIYIASKNLPAIINNNSSVSIIASNTSIVFNEQDGVPGGISSNIIKTNGSNRSTILSKALYIVKDNIAKLLTDTQTTSLYNLPSNELVAELNNNNYYYSPFYYILDRTQLTFKSRAYHLDEPKITGRKFIDYNNKLNFTISTTDVNSILIDNTYVITLTAAIPLGLNNVHCLLRYFDTESSLDIYLVGNIVQNQTTLTVTFNIETNFDITQYDQITLTNLRNSNLITIPVLSNLEEEFDILYLVESNDATLTTQFDNLISSNFYQNSVIGVTYEKITIEFGVPLPYLYVPSRDLIQTKTYLTYTQNVYATYPEPVYQMNETGRVITVVNGAVTFVKLHDIGDPILDGNGNPVILHTVGDFILDVNGNKVVNPNSQYYNLSEVGITLISAKYRFGTTNIIQTYYKNVARTIISFLNNEVAVAAGKLAERTELYYKPRSVTKNIKVSVGGNTEIFISSLLDFNITFYLIENAINDISIQTEIISATRNVILSYINNNTISTDKIIKDLTLMANNNIVSVEMKRFINDSYSILTLINSDESFNIGDVSRLNPDGTIDVIDSIVINFKTAI